MTNSQRYYDVFVGTYGSAREEAIHWLVFDSKEGTLEKESAVSGVANPSFVAVNQAGNRLYAVSEVRNGEVVSFAINFANKELREISRQTSGGAAPCYISVGRNDQWLFTANYSGGNVAARPLNHDGTIAAICDVKNYDDQSTERTSHPHTIVNIPGTEKYIVSDLGLDRLYLYEFDATATKLILINEVSAVAGSGPRHIAIHPLRQMIYVINELNASISVYSYDAKVEQLELMQQVATIPSDYDGINDCADIHIAPSGSHLYASNRGHNSIAAYEIGQDGKLSLLDYSSTKGDWPRNFAIVSSGEYILAANERTHSIVVMKIGNDGIPRATGDIYRVNSPVCLHVVARN